MFRKFGFATLALGILLLLSLALMSVNSWTARAQDAKSVKALTEADVIALIANQIDDRVIVGRIQKHSLAFTVDQAALKRIKQANPSAEVLAALRPVDATPPENLGGEPVLLARFLDVKGEHLKPLRDRSDFVLEEATWDAKKKQVTYKGWFKNKFGGFEVKPYGWETGMCKMVWLDGAEKEIAETKDFKVIATGAKDPKTGDLRVWLTIDFSDEVVAKAVGVQIDKGAVFKATAEKKKADSGDKKNSVLPIAKEKWDVTGFNEGDLLVKAWDLQLSTIKPVGNKAVSIELVFGEDTGPTALGVLEKHLKNKDHYFHFYDGKVSITKTNNFKLIGEVTGKKGDAIRLDLVVPDVDLQSITKVKVIYDR